VPATSCWPTIRKPRSGVIADAIGDRLPVLDVALERGDAFQYVGIVHI